MTTQRGGNVFVAGINGNFDDAQNGVKRLFADKQFADDLSDAGYALSSANSINIGRLLPQIVYYFHAYGQMAARYGLNPGDSVNFTVPTGNFGNILAAFYAREMGLPIRKLVCASNINKVLADFFNTGVYDRNRAFHRTASPSMDILISSNLERFIYYTAGERTAGLMKDLAATGVFKWDISNDAIRAYFASEAETFAAIKEVWDGGYLIDTHTAVAYACYKQYRAETGDDTPNIITATASPFKFAEDVLAAITADTSSVINNTASVSNVASDACKTVTDNPFATMAALARLTGAKIPAVLSELADLPELHAAVCDPDEMGNLLRARFR